MLSPGTPTLELAESGGGKAKPRFARRVSWTPGAEGAERGAGVALECLVGGMACNDY